MSPFDAPLDLADVAFEALDALSPRRAAGTPLRLPDGPRVTPAWLAAHLAHPAVRVLDVRGRATPAGVRGTRRVGLDDDYRAGHVPGAHFVDWSRCLIPAVLARASDPTPDDLLRARLAQLGVGPGDTVVLYDDTFGLYAARGRFVLEGLGFASVRVLDGGWSQWRAEGRAVSQTSPAASAVPAVGAPRGDARVATHDDVARALARGWVIDARLPAAYEGRVSDGRRPGHIPGAVSVPYHRVCGGDFGRFSSPAEIRRALAQAGLNPARVPADVVVYCAAGTAAAAVREALSLLGIHARIYEDGIVGWSRDPTRPVMAGMD
ncbi:MAG: rhodanese-like domain-containing protein [Polyangiales bacterium]